MITDPGVGQDPECAPAPPAPHLPVEPLVARSPGFEKLLTVEHPVLVIQVVLHVPDKERDSLSVEASFDTGDSHGDLAAQKGPKGQFASPVPRAGRAGLGRALSSSCFGTSTASPPQGPSRPSSPSSPSFLLHMTKRTRGGDPGQIDPGHEHV